MNSGSAAQDTYYVHCGYQKKGLHQTRSAIAALIVCMPTLSACNSKPQHPAPATYPVTGIVSSPKGRSLAGGCVEFKPKENEWELTSTGVIDTEGKFTLQIPFVDRVIPGATQGPHRVYVIMPLGAQREGGGHVPIPGEFVVKPGENRFTITLPSGP